jgi:hypothetical protein
MRQNVPLVPGLDNEEVLSATKQGAMSKSAKKNEKRKEKKAESSPDNGAPPAPAAATRCASQASMQSTAGGACSVSCTCSVWHLNYSLFVLLLPAAHNQPVKQQVKHQQHLLLKLTHQSKRLKNR